MREKPIIPHFLRCSGFGGVVCSYRGVEIHNEQERCSPYAGSWFGTRGFGECTDAAAAAGVSSFAPEFNRPRWSHRFFYEVLHQQFADDVRWQAGAEDRQGVDFD